MGEAEKVIYITDRLPFRSESAFLAHRVLGALRTLPLEQQGAVGLRFMLGYDDSELALALGTSEEEALRLAFSGLRNLHERVFS